MNNLKLILAMVPMGIVGMGSLRAEAEALHAVQPLPGYSCMALNLTEREMFDPSAAPPVMAAPSPNAQKIGAPSSVVITEDPVRSENGYIAMLMPNGQKGWVIAAKLRPYRNATNPSTRCIPAIMSDGRPGLTFRH